MHYLTPNEKGEILQLRQQGCHIKEIARRMGVCEATISKVVKGTLVVRKKKNFPERNNHETRPFKEEDFSTYPDNAFFQHVRIWDFIG